MILEKMFLKDIGRDIRGVVKVAQTSDTDIHQELDEYVVTQELHKHFSKFYENYQKGIDGHTDKMGVWISGFFGSGKSHFLKILAYLLENKGVTVEEEGIYDKRPVDYFQDKVLDPITYANMQRTAKVETETILFNIDSESPIDNKSKEDAILRIFLKVFNNHQGYFGDVPGIAEMEKYLDKQGVYDAFKEAFHKQAGEPWVNRRNTFYFDVDYVVGALTEVTDMSEETARNWCENGVDNYEISIGQFAKEIREYVEEKGDNFHLVFLVDEIGQYIGDNSNLMLNLQTLTEDLGTETAGKVWIMVTSQESIDSVVKVKGDDFSRIQGRFDTRLSLSSISVDEVLKKRILQKHDFVEDKLKAIYPEKSAILKNLISFRNSTADLRGFTNEQEFAEVYPFVPYQFKLLQNVFEQIRKHGSSGKSLSEGERSMLSAYKETALRYKDEEEGFIIPFHAFYETIKEFLNPVVSRVIEGAYVNPALKDDEFNIDLLKVLFMIKYIKELPPNLYNLATLMVTHIDEDKLELKEKIQVALRKLEIQTLIQKNGDDYFFLTDEEQDINREIKSINLDENAVTRELATEIFQDIYDEKRYNYSKEHAFPFNTKMDERNYGNQSSSIGVHIFSPLSDGYGKSDQELMMETSGSGEMIVKLGGNESYVEEIEEVLRIEEYRKHNPPHQQSETVQNILNNKQAEIRERRRRMKNLLTDAIKEGTFFVNGTKLETVRGSTVREKMNTAFHILVENVYTKLGLIKAHIENEATLKAFISVSHDQFDMDDVLDTNPNELALREVHDFISMQDDMNKQVRVKVLYDHFGNQPFGWKTLDIAALIAELLKDQRIRIRYHAEYLEPETDVNKLMTVFTKTNDADVAIITKRVKVDEALIRTARSICKEIFNKTDLPDDEDGLVSSIRELIEEQVQEINKLKIPYNQQKYPGLSLLDKGLEYFNGFHKGLDNVSYLTKLKELEEELMDWEEDIIYVKNFFSSNQQNLFDQGLAALKQYEDNKIYLLQEEIETVVKKLQAIITNPIPYGQIKKIPELVNTFNNQLTTILNEKKENALKKINSDYEELLKRTREYDVSPETKELVERFYQNLNESVEEFSEIHRVDAAIQHSTDFKDQTHPKITQDINEARRIRKARQEAAAKGNSVGEQPEPQDEQPVTVERELVDLKQLVEVTTLSTEDEVEEYINQLSNKLKAIIRTNKEVEIK